MKKKLNKKNKEQIEFLYTIASTGAEVRSYKNESFRLIFRNVRRVEWFTDRPARKAGKMSIDNFMSIWSLGSDSFSKNPPNAALIGERTSDGKTEEMIVTLSKPAISCSKNRISFKITPVAGSKINAGHLDNAILCIDDSAFEQQMVLANEQAFAQATPQEIAQANAANAAFTALQETQESTGGVQLGGVGNLGGVGIPIF